MDASPEELALNLSRASVMAQEQIENQIREKATAVLAAASIVVPAIALVVGHGPSVVAIPFGVAAVAYALCVRECGIALLSRGVHIGLLGGELLEDVRDLDADLGQMQASAALYLDSGYRYNRANLARATNGIQRAIMMLTGEIIALVAAVLLILVH